MFNPFETPWLLLIIGTIIFIIGGCIRNYVSPRKGLWLVLLGIATAAAAVGLDYYVKTDYEQVRGLIYTCRKAVVDGDAKAIGPCISQQYQDSVHSSKASFMADAERIIKIAGISLIRFRTLTFQFTDTTAHAQLGTTVFMDAQKSAEAAGGLFFVDMELYFAKEKDRWFITTAEVKAVNNDPTNWSITH